MSPIFPAVHRCLPVIFSRNDRVLAPEELLLAFGGYVLGLFGGSYPDTGIIIHGPKFSFKTVRLAPKYPTIERIAAELSSLSTSKRRPPLVLNSHCRACEFQPSCMAEAKEQDNLSLLHRMTEKTIRQYNSKGILTVSQLSYTFHPRRKSKRAKARGRPHSFPLQAMAIRDQKVYVLAPPALPSADTQAFIDMEGDLDGRFVYLIGLLVVQGDRETCHSFWADTREDEAVIFEQLDRALSRLTDVHLFHYGSYESRVLKRAGSRSAAQSKPSLLVSTRSTNLLSQI